MRNSFMKKRIKIDSAVLSFIIILTGFLYQFPHLYSTNPLWDNVLDFFGLIMILKGTYVRMAARGHKKEHSGKGQELVNTGLYAYTRNPMYLGSFFIGAGFVLIVWPWWTLPVFAWAFYLRFKRQIVKEEKYLKKHFSENYKVYCREVPRIFPCWKVCRKINVKQVLPWDEVWSTKEKRGLIAWPALALVLETIQEKIVFDTIHIPQTVFVFLAAMSVFAAVLWYRYRKG